MDKMKFETADLTARNVEKIAALFPNCATEMRNERGGVTRGIDFALLKQMLSPAVVEGAEHYEFSWVGKKAAIVEANRPIRKTLRPFPEESKDWDTTGNLYIEGDNLEVLKLLQESYLGKVKMIYIDPPYNTGHDFVYPDSFVMDDDSYDEGTRRFNADGTVNYARENSASAAKYHSDWCSMMYSRLLLARNLLTEDGVIFISIDDNEQENLKKICDEVFGVDNFVSEIVIQNNPRGRQSDRFVATTHEYLLCFSKNCSSCFLNGMQLSEDQKKEYCFTDEHGAYRLLGLRQRGAASLREDRPEMFFPIYVNPQTLEISLTSIKGWREVLPRKSDGRDGRWMWGKKKCETDISSLVARVIARRCEYDIFVKDYLERDGSTRTRKPKSVWADKVLNNQFGTQEVKALLGGELMSFPKSRAFIELICQMGSVNDSIILDFFSGSATTAHAVMQLNAEDGGKRKFIMVQLAEPCDEKSEAFKAGYTTICEIGKERIRRAGEKIRQEHPEAKDLDVGFRVLKVANSNMKDVFYAPEDYDQDLLAKLESNIKEDRSALDLLFGCLLEWGLPLGLPYTVERIEGCAVHVYNDGDLIACFEKKIPESVVVVIARRKPLRAVFRDSGFADSPAKINVFEIFKRFMPEDADDISKRVRVL